MISQIDWQKRNGNKAHVVWLTGLSGAGKTTIGEKLLEELDTMNIRAVLLDGDSLRKGLCSDLGFSDDDRSENIRRIGEVAKLFFQQGNVVICSLISPFRKDRDHVRTMFPHGSFSELFVRCPLEICIERDPKGLYKKNIPQFTGISSPYEEPENPELIIDTDTLSIEESVQKCLQHITAHTRLIFQEISPLYK